MEALRAAAEASGQGHIFSDWDSLSSAEQQALVEDVREMGIHIPMIHCENSGERRLRRRTAGTRPRRPRCLRRLGWLGRPPLSASAASAP